MVGKVFIETSIFIRYFTQDDKEKYHDCAHLLEIVESGKLRPYISNIVVLEIVFVLTRIYKFSQLQVIHTIEEILQLRNLTVIEETDSRKALKLLKETNIKYTDCLIAIQVPSGAKLVTYDADFGGIPHLSVSTPKELIA